MVPSISRGKWPIAILAGLVAVTATCGCEAARKSAGPGVSNKPADAKPQSARGSGLRLPSFGGGGYATTFTILCMEAAGPDGARMVDLMAKGLRNVKGLDPNLVQVQAKGNSNRLYYGAYKGVPRKETDEFIAPDQARQELTVIRNMASGQAQPFQLARIVEAPTPDPGPAEWDLKSAPGLYTLQITYVFDKPGLPNHKEVAVEICKTLRQQGEEAWYLHDDRISVVTVGHFDESALAKGPDGKVTGYGPAVVALQNKREEFKYNTECLRKVTHVIGKERIVAPSQLIQIPKEPTNAPPERTVAPPIQRPGAFGYR